VHGASTSGAGCGSNAARPDEDGSASTAARAPSDQELASRRALLAAAAMARVQAGPPAGLLRAQNARRKSESPAPEIIDLT
jgi:hypothetical protein